MMKHVEFLEKLSTLEIIEMIEDYKILHYETGELPKTSRIRDLAKMVSEDFVLPYNIGLGENALIKEIIRRFYNEHKPIEDEIL